MIVLLVLQVKEVASAGGHKTVDPVLAHAEDMLVQGKYAQAAGLLEKGLSGMPSLCTHTSFGLKINCREVGGLGTSICQKTFVRGPLQGLQKNFQVADCGDGNDSRHYHQCIYMSINCCNSDKPATKQGKWRSTSEVMQPPSREGEEMARFLKSRFLPIVPDKKGVQSAIHGLSTCRHSGGGCGGAVDR